MNFQQEVEVEYTGGGTTFYQILLTEDPDGECVIGNTTSVMHV
jgi:hypothetical protein